MLFRIMHNKNERGCLLSFSEFQDARTRSLLALWNLKIWLDEKMQLVIIFVTNDSQQFQMCIVKNIMASFHEFSTPQRVAKKPRKSSNRPIFDDKLVHVNWNMKSQTRHKDILERQFENTPLSTGDNEEVSCLGLHSWFSKFITENGTRMTILRVLRVLSLFRTIRNHLKEEWRHFPTHI